MSDNIQLVDISFQPSPPEKDSEVVEEEAKLQNNMPLPDKTTRLMSVREHLSQTSSPRRSSRVASATNCLDPQLRIETPHEESSLKSASCDNCKMPFDGKTSHVFEGRSLCDVCFDLQTAKICNHCKAPINCFSQNHRYYSSKDGSKNWHDYCLQCSSCKVVVLAESKRYKLNEATLCAECYDRKGGKTCSNCKMPIYRRSKGQRQISSKDGKRHFHDYCLNCYGCGKNLVRQPFYVHETGGTYCPSCFDVKVGDTCSRCQKLIKTMSEQQKKCVLSDGTKWHESCLSCDDCHKQLIDKKLYLHASSLLCAACYDQKTAFLCVNCKRHINCNSEGHQKYSSKDGTQHWHEHCLLCWQCNRPLAGRVIFWRENRMFCGVCRNNSANFRKSSLDIVLERNGTSIL